MEFIKLGKIIKYSNNLNSEIVSFRLLNGEGYLFTAPCPIRDQINGDVVAAMALEDTMGVLALADGAGGTKGGNEASNIIIQTIFKKIKSTSKKASLRESILDGIESSNNKLLKLKLGSGSTICILEITQLLNKTKGSTLRNRIKVRPYHVGDSTILVVGQKGNIKIYPTLHSPRGYAVEAGFIAENAPFDPSIQYEVSNLVGTNDMSIEVGTGYILNPNDTVFLASDGITDNIVTRDIIDIIRAGNLKESAENLYQSCSKKMAGKNGKPDDFSFILFRIDKSLEVV